jgi:hypothetical protein
MRQVATNTVTAINGALRDVWAVVEKFATTGPIDFNGRRLSNLANGTEATDAVTLQQLQPALDALGLSHITRVPSALEGSGSGKVRVGLFAARGSASAHSGEWFLASDRNYVGWLSDGSNWRYAFGVQSGTLSPDQKPTLTTSDTGYRFRSTDFAREYRWTGSAWEDAPGQPARGQIVHFPITIHADFAPGTGWQLCDGTGGVTRSTPTGGTTTFSAPSLNNTFLRGVTGVTGGTGGNATAHVHSIDPPNTTSGNNSAGHTHSVDPPNTTSGNNSASQAVQSGAGITVAAHTHTHDTNIGSFTSGAESNTHTHDVDIAAFSSAGPSGTAGDDALPPYYNARPYIRL